MTLRRKIYTYTTVAVIDLASMEHEGTSSSGLIRVWLVLKHTGNHMPCTPDSLENINFKSKKRLLICREVKRRKKGGDWRRSHGCCTNRHDGKKSRMKMPS